MNRKDFEFTKMAARTAYEEAIRTGDGGSVENHRHPDYSLVDHEHQAGEHTHDDYTSKDYVDEQDRSWNAFAEEQTKDLIEKHTPPVVILTQAEFDELEDKSEGTLYVVM